MRVAAIVVAAGAGERFGDRKQFAEIAGVSAATRAVTAARSVAAVVVLVAPADSTDDAHGADLVVPGGPTRSRSVRAGLAAIDERTEIVVVHDAALVEALGLTVAVVPGEAANRKLTTRADLDAMAAQAGS